MRSFIALSILFLVVACKGKKLKPAIEEIEIVETNTGRIDNSEKGSASDTLALLKAFKIFCQALNNEDGFLLKAVSADKKYFPLSLTGMLELPPGFPDFSINRPVKKMYNQDIWNAIETIQPFMYARTNHYEIYYRTNHTSKKMTTKKRYSFRFIKEGNAFKFSEFESVSVPQGSEPSSDIMTWYFPQGNYAGISAGDNLHLNMYTNISYSLTLREFEEPVLYNYRGLDEIYRITWLRAFHLPIVFRFQKQGFNFLLTTKVLLQRSNEYPDELETNTITSVSFFKWYKFKGKLAEADFWKLNSNDASAQPNDGSEWMVEGVKEGKYQMIARWSPEPDLRKACLYLLSISNLKIPKRDIY